MAAHSRRVDRGGQLSHHTQRLGSQSDWIGFQHLQGDFHGLREGVAATTILTRKIKIKRGECSLHWKDAVTVRSPVVCTRLQAPREGAMDTATKTCVFPSRLLGPFL